MNSTPYLRIFENLSQFLQQTPTPYHLYHYVKQTLLNRGFEYLDEQQDWSCLPAGRYFVQRNHSSILAFVHKPHSQHGWKILAAHSDSPQFRLMPESMNTHQGYFSLGLKTHGGVMLNSWFDRSLGYAGIVLADQKYQLIQHHDPCLTIAQLGLHLNRQANKQLELSPHLFQAFCSWPVKENYQNFYQYLQYYEFDNQKQISAGDLFLYDSQAPQLLEPHWIQAQQLDNKISCFTGLQALDQADYPENTLFAIFDHEEIGSQSFHGAHSHFLLDVLSRLHTNQQDYQRKKMSSHLVSIDVAHAYHPLHSQAFDPNEQAHLGQGFCLKHYKISNNWQANQHFKNIAHDIHLQNFAYPESKPSSGGTLGYFLSASLGIPVVDVGQAIWAMHSARETASLKDLSDGIKIIERFFQHK